MMEWISTLEKWLPHWLQKTQLKWIQWVYALWQLVRCNPLILLVLSFLPFYLAQRRKKKAVVVLEDSQDYNMSVEDMNAYFNNHSVNNLEIVSRLGNWFAVMHGGYIYLTHQNTMCEVAKCSQLFGENVIFVERLLTVTSSLAVGRKLSQTEAYQKILSKRYHCSRGADYVIPTFLDYVDLNSKIWDYNRDWLYKVYDNLFDRFAKLVKLRVFKERTALYDFCSIFSSRWRYSDTVKKFAYVAQPGEPLKLRCYNKLKSLQDIQIDGWEDYWKDPNDQNICMEIVGDRAYCSFMQYGERYAQASLGRPVYVS